MRMEPTQLIQVAISENVLVQAVLTLDNNKVKWFVGVPLKGHPTNTLMHEIPDTTAQALLLAKSLSK